MTRTLAVRTPRLVLPRVEASVTREQTRISRQTPEIDNLGLGFQRGVVSNVPSRSVSLTSIPARYVTLLPKRIS